MDNLTEVKLIYRNDRFFVVAAIYFIFESRFFSGKILLLSMKITTINIKILENENGKQFGDLPEFMDFEYFKKNVGVNVSVLAKFIKSPSKPENISKMDVKELTNFTTIHWENQKMEKL